MDFSRFSGALQMALGATLQATQTVWQQATIYIALQDLSRYPEQAVLAALERCRLELRFPMRTGDIVERIDDGRPAADEAWAQVSAGLDERATVVATDEALEALGEVRHLADDPNAARMGFRAAYQRITQERKAAGIAPKWIPSLGHDPEGREPALREAADKGRIEHSQIIGLLGAATTSLALPPRSEEDRMREGRERAGALLAQLVGSLKADRRQQRAREPRIDWQAEEERLQREGGEAA